MGRLPEVFSPPSARWLELTSSQPLRVDPGVSREYIPALYRVLTATARWKAQLTGPQTPWVVWPEHFGLSTLRVFGQVYAVLAPTLTSPS
jgi:hypothetical protein